MKRFIPRLLFFSLLFSLIGPAHAISGDLDLEITNAELTPCIQEIDLEDPLYFAMDYINPNVILDNGYHAYAEGVYHDVSQNRDFSERAPDGSWYRYEEHDNNIYGSFNGAVICLAVDFTAEGDFSQFGSVNDDVPRSWDTYFDYIARSFKISAVLVPSTPIPDHVLAPFHYQNKWKIVGTQHLQPTNRVLFAMDIYESNINPNDSLDLLVAIDNTMNPYGLFERTWFNNTTRHYNDGSSIPETDEMNNFLYVEDFLDFDMEHPAQPSIAMVSSDDDSFTVEWDPVPGVDHYVVRHLQNELNVVDLSTVEETEQTTTTADIEYDQSGRFLDCVNVVPVNADGFIGKFSDDVCFGSLFSDVDSREWHSAYTHNALQNGIISGYASAEGTPLGYFGPGDSITTTQALKMAATLTNRFIHEDFFSFTLPYSVPAHFKGHWGYEYIWSAHILDFDLVEGIETFDTNRDITRAEMINLVMESMELDVPDYSEYSLNDIEGHEYADEIELAFQLGIVSGYGTSGTFGPDNSLLRAEAVKIFVESGNKLQLSWPGQTF
jgi:hypothetical protein